MFQVKEALARRCPLLCVLLLALGAGAASAANGECGVAAGRSSLFFPAQGLCRAGTYLAHDTLGLDGGFNWTCAGSHGDASAQCSATPVSPPEVADFTAFESAPVRPLALSADGARLYVANTPDNRLVIYDVTDAGLSLAAEVPVGLEPVAVALRRNAQGRTEAWVVNHLSDSVSVVEIDPADATLSQTVRTLLVGDEPRDIVFAGPGRGRAFITAAHRGQNRRDDPQLTRPGVPRADVWVFDAETLGARLGGTPVTVLSLFGDTPRALAASSDGASVYAAVYQSGNRSTTIPQPIVSATLGLPPAPEGAEPGAPEVGLVVQRQGDRWVDELGRDWSAQLPFSLPDYDVFRIDANADLPFQTAAWSGVGTVLFNMAVRPDNGKLYVSNTEAMNQVRFEPVLAGQFIRNRITVISGDTVQPQHLNPHIDYSRVTGAQDEIARSLAQPLDLAFSADGRRVYVAAFGSGKVAALDTAALEAGNIEGEQIATGLGPAGLAVDTARDRLYVLNRIDGTLSIIGMLSGASPSVTTLALPANPEPESLRDGRRFLYDAATTSGHGDVSCASCHLFGDDDQLAWDLGNPYGQVLPFANLPLGSQIPGGDAFGANESIHPMKGPMSTQSLRGLADAGPMHWRGDKTGGLTPEGEADPAGDPMDENAAFLRFNGAFTGLQGRAAALSDAEMQAFADFALQLRYPPNPIKRLDDAETASQRQGHALFLNNEIIPGPDAHNCAFCHQLPLTTSSLIAKALFETKETVQDEFKIPHLRNLYTKVGMFGAAEGAIAGQPERIVGDQIRGFGYLHDGSIASLEVLLNHPSNFVTGQNNPHGLSKSSKRENLIDYLLSIDTGLRPAVGQQVTVDLGGRRDPAVMSRLHLLLEQADRGAGDLVAKGVWGGAARGALFVGSGAFETDRAADGPISLLDLLGMASAAGGPLTFTLVPPGNGLRIGLDRNLDGFRDSDALTGGNGGPASRSEPRRLP